jgi:hypothetical protein
MHARLPDVELVSPPFERHVAFTVAQDGRAAAPG